MRIVYAVAGLWTHHPGLQAKVLGAARIWAESGHEVFIVLHSQGLVLGDSGDVIASSKDACFSGQKLDYYDRGKSKLKRLMSLRHQYRFLREQLRDLAPEAVYTRYTLPLPGVHRSFNVTCPFIVEINSDDSVEYGVKSRAVGAFNSAFRRSFLEKAGGLCFVSHEMAQSAAFSWYQGKTTVISNGIDCRGHDFIEETGNDKVNLCFIGSPRQSWHGLDKVLTMAAAFPEWAFHIIGPDQAEVSRFGDAGLANLVCHGYLPGQQARDLVAGMDVGIGTLALHRIGMHEASPLKSRQYLAHGVPLISAYRDTDVAGEAFVLQLPNVEDNIIPALESIRGFVEGAFANRQLRRRARAFAEEKLDISVKERQRIEFICSTVS